MRLSIYLDIDPPTATAQEQKTTIRGGHPRKYDPKNVKAAKQLLADALEGYRPDVPLDGPLALYVEWRFPTGSRPARATRTASGGSPAPTSTTSRRASATA